MVVSVILNEILTKRLWKEKGKKNLPYLSVYFTQFFILFFQYYKTQNTYVRPSVRLAIPKRSTVATWN